MLVVVHHESALVLLCLHHNCTNKTKNRIELFSFSSSFFVRVEFNFVGKIED